MPGASRGTMAKGGQRAPSLDADVTKNGRCHPFLTLGILGKDLWIYNDLSILYIYILYYMYIYIYVYIYICIYIYMYIYICIYIYMYIYICIYIYVYVYIYIYRYFMMRIQPLRISSVISTKSEQQEWGSKLFEL